MNTYGACTKPTQEIVYGKRENKDFVCNSFCSKECLNIYKGEGKGSRVIKQLASKVYEKQNKEFKAFLQAKQNQIEKPHTWKNHDCSFKVKKEKIKNRVVLKKPKTEYVLDKSGKFPEYKRLQDKMKDDIFYFNKKWIPIDPNKVDYWLIKHTTEKLDKGWLDKSLKRWSKMPKNTMEYNLYLLNKKPKKANLIIKMLPNAPVVCKTASGKEKIDKNYWKGEYLSRATLDMPTEIPFEIRYYLAAETYQELYNENFSKTMEKKGKWKYKELDNKDKKKKSKDGVK